jgi:hypothetical protein
MGLLSRPSIITGHFAAGASPELIAERIREIAG